jgi:hypothetical protein
MKMVVHYATCPTWVSGQFVDCTCFLVAPWRIVKEPGEQYPWRIWRRTAGDSYEPFMRASTWHGAFQLVEQMIWLRNNALIRKETNA